MGFTTKLVAQADFKKALLEQYGEAIERSRRQGHRVSFRVEVDPAAGAQTITPVEEQATPRAEAFPVEETRKPDPDLEAALATARERGRRRVGEILAGDEMVSAEAFASLLGTSRITVNTKRQTGQVLGLEGTKRGFRFPTWQLDEDGRPYDALPALHERFGKSAWAVYHFLVSPHGALDGRTGLDALRRGNTEAVVAAAESIAQGDFR